MALCLALSLAAPRVQGLAPAFLAPEVAPLALDLAPTCEVLAPEVAPLALDLAPGADAAAPDLAPAPALAPGTLAPDELLDERDTR